MSTETVRKPARPERSDNRQCEAESVRHPSNLNALVGAVQQVWCAPMNEEGEWVVTWTRTPGAIAYELQTSVGPGQWSSSMKFSGTRAVLLLGPQQRCCVRVRAIGSDGPGAWSSPNAPEKHECSVAA